MILTTARRLAAPLLLLSVLIVPVGAQDAAAAAALERVCREFTAAAKDYASELVPQTREERAVLELLEELVDGAEKLRSVLPAPRGDGRWRGAPPGHEEAAEKTRKDLEAWRARERRFEVRRELEPDRVEASYGEARRRLSPLLPIAGRDPRLSPTAPRSPGPGWTKPPWDRSKLAAAGAPVAVVHTEDGGVPVVAAVVDDPGGPVYARAADGRALLVQEEPVTQAHTELNILADGAPGPFEVFRGPDPPAPVGWTPAVRALVTSRAGAVLEFDQGPEGVSPEDLERPLLGGLRAARRFRHGAARITWKRVAPSVLWWVDVRAGSDTVRIHVQLHRGDLEGSNADRADWYFRSIRLRVPPGWKWRSEFPAPYTRDGYLVAPDEAGAEHVVPQRKQVDFRLTLKPVGQPWEPEGWGVGRLEDYHHLPQRVKLPDLPRAALVQASQAERATDFMRFASGQASNPGDSAPGLFAHTEGVRYGGMTGGVDRHQLEGVRAAITGSGWSLWARRASAHGYAVRQMGLILEDGEAFDPDEWPGLELYSNVIYGGPLDWPPPGPSRSYREWVAYPAEDDGHVWLAQGHAPIDPQHYERKTKDEVALVYLSNDPWSRDQLAVDAALIRATFDEVGSMVGWTTPGRGGSWGREHAWAAWTIAADVDARAARGDVDPGAIEWLLHYVDGIERAQMPSGLVQALEHGKIATDPPFGDGQTANWRAGRINENLYAIGALVAIAHVVPPLLPWDDALDLWARCRAVVARACVGVRDYAWVPGEGGPRDRYAAGPLEGPAFATYPDGVPRGPAVDGYHVFTAPGYALWAGVGMGRSVRWYTGRSDLAGALQALEGEPNANLPNRANSIAELRLHVEAQDAALEER